LRSAPWRGVAEGEDGSFEVNSLKALSPEGTLFKAEGRSFAAVRNPDRQAWMLCCLKTACLLRLVRNLFDL